MTTEDLIRAVAERRLAQVCDALGLVQGHFDRAQEASQQALDGEADKVLSEQLRLATASLAQISGPLVRARLVGLIVAIAELGSSESLSTPDSLSDQISHQQQR